MSARKHNSIFTRDPEAARVYGAMGGRAKRGTKHHATVLKEIEEYDKLDELKEQAIKVWARWLNDPKESEQRKAVAKITPYLFPIKREIDSKINAQLGMKVEIVYTDASGGKEIKNVEVAQVQSVENAQLAQADGDANLPMHMAREMVEAEVINQSE